MAWDYSIEDYWSFDSTSHIKSVWFWWRPNLCFLFSVGAELGVTQANVPAIPVKMWTKSRSITQQCLRFGVSFDAARSALEMASKALRWLLGTRRQDVQKPQWHSYRWRSRLQTKGCPLFPPYIFLTRNDQGLCWNSVVQGDQCSNPSKAHHIPRHSESGPASECACEQLTLTTMVLQFCAVALDQNQCNAQYMPWFAFD